MENRQYWKTKIKFKTQVRLVMLHRCEAWKITIAEEEKTGSLQFTCMRKILKIWGPQRVNKWNNRNDCPKSNWQPKTEINGETELQIMCLIAWRELGRFVVYVCFSTMQTLWLYEMFYNIVCILSMSSSMIYVVWRDGVFLAVWGKCMFLRFQIIRELDFKHGMQPNKHIIIARCQFNVNR